VQQSQAAVTTAKTKAGHTPGTDRAAVAVLKELKLYEQASGGCIAMLSLAIDRETAASDMLAASRLVLAALHGRLAPEFARLEDWAKSAAEHGSSKKIRREGVATLALIAAVARATQPAA
jgi:hypothetical protein